MISKIPNFLTLSRILILPVFLLMYWFRDLDSRIIFFLLFSYASITDFLDGYLAKKYSFISTFGRIFDPIADKSLILIICIMIMVTNINLIPYIFIPISLLLLRELIISGLREGVANMDLVIKVSPLSRYKAACQMISLGILILSGNENYFVSFLNWIGVLFLYVSLFISVLTSVKYYLSIHKNITI